MNGLKLLTPNTWSDYELLDSGGFEKLERFGKWVLRRPEPQALWDKSLPESEWAAAHAAFRKTGEERGEWTLKPGMPEQWHVEYPCGDKKLRMRLGLTSFKHVGIFPEQACNWDFIYEKVRAAGGGRVLNLVAYTGGATLAAAAAGAEVTHVDSVKQVVTWARGNVEASGLDGVRWIVDDASKFVQREVRRGSVYAGIILDPPAYGRGPDGEKWVLEQGLPALMRDCAQLLAPGGFLVLNLYSMGLSALLARGLAAQVFGPAAAEEFGELYVTDRSGKALPLGIFYRR
jgi:23S rRNA (cytosine1962-C5)-methyltransferase